MREPRPGTKNDDEEKANIQRLEQKQEELNQGGTEEETVEVSVRLNQA